ncbi:MULTISPECIES: DUF2027 domain-containing protein [Segatella]|jgi:hypothetical protein|uniref:Uncharacterized protein n=2 Tax=Segatella TaxID=2974251 RepID=D8DWL3_9BACT|nr:MULTISPECIES: DUF2027 domain-containing protein [Segatella]MBQ3857717.1 DUF2027 domain-containing protein [Prevotella sp.]EFI72273.1 conserved hypothetical protein [Segatella baroniae B14]MEE3415400.1 DUF2027 domain-containing protein [Prevotella sp.]OYP53487.1 DUF2027 domain-containing protein [Segatella bryantii]UKK78483.1 DUF2027 domain-containing protein [Segatella baroniae B14]
MKVKIGDKVRFLSETGGGKVAGFQKGNIVLVEDEDGFQIPTPITDIVVVEQDDYSMGKMINEKMDAREAAEAHANTELAHDSRSIKSMLSAHDEAVSMEVDDYDPADREITFQKQVEERQGGNKLSAFLAFVPKNIKEFEKTEFECYLVNDSNYYLQYVYFISEGNAWTLKAQGVVEPNMKLFIEDVNSENLNDLGRVAMQMMAFKKDKPFLLKPAIDVQFRIDPIKFYKFHAFEENDFFEQPSLLYTIVDNDEVARPLIIDSKRLKAQMYKDDAVVAQTEKKKTVKDDGTIIVDLHADEVLETTQGMNSADILHYQIDYFKKIMDENKKKKGQKIIFIHGKGEGVLRQALVHELNYRYKNCTYQDASFQEYGYGATQVTIR